MRDSNMRATAAVLTVALLALVGCSDTSTQAAKSTQTSATASTPSISELASTSSAPTTTTDPASKSVVTADTTGVAETQLPADPIVVSSSPKDTATDNTTEPIRVLSGWKGEPVGAIDAAIGGIDLLAFNPAGLAVAFSTVETSCCSNDVRAWFRPAGGKWASIDSDRANFVAGINKSGAYGGPTDLVWFKDRFVAVGARGGSVEPATASSSTTWVSLDGQNWSAVDEQLSSRAIGLTPSINGETLLGAWATDAGKVVVRSTTDGVTWKYLSSMTAGSLGVSLYPTAIATVGRSNQSPRILIVGSLSLSQIDTTSAAFVAESTNEKVWALSALPQLPDPTPNISVSAQTIVDLGVAINIYGTLSASQSDSTPILWRSSDEKGYDVQIIDPGCSGTQTNTGSLTSIVATASPRDPQMVAVCSFEEGPAEGDYIPIISQLVSSADGITFTPNTPTASGWPTPSVEADIGPVLINNGALVVAVTTPGPGDRRLVALWGP
jgi:hypothetical protein